MSSTVRRLFGVRLVALAASGAIAACGGGSSAAPAANGSAAAKPPRVVKTIRADEARVERTVAVTGTLAAEDQVTVSFKTAGRLETLSVDLGSTASQGEELGRLVPRDFSLRVAQAEAALQQARARLGLTGEGQDDAMDVSRASLVRQARAVLDQARLTRDRAASFAKRGIGSQADLDAAEADFRVAEGRYQDAIEEVRNRQALLLQRRTELELAKQALADSRLHAPFSGRVRERHATPGQYLAAGAPVVTIVKIHPLRLRLSIPERDAAAVRAGQRVKVTVEGDPAAHEGRVVRISPAIEETSRTLNIEAEVGNPQGLLRPGSFANAEVITETHQTAIVIPASAVVSFAGVDRVFAVKDGKAVERRVTIGRRLGDRVEVAKGLASGESIVVDPGNLVDGEAVKAAGGGA